MDSFNVPLMVEDDAWNILHIACDQGVSFKRIKFILDNGGAALAARPNGAGRTALMMLVQSHKPEKLNELLDIFMQNGCECPPYELHPNSSFSRHAFKRGYLPAPVPKEMDFDRICKTQNTFLLKYLLKLYRWMTLPALLFATKTNYPNAFKFALTLASPEEASEAAKQCWCDTRVEMLQALIDRGADPTLVIDSENNTLYACVIRSG